MAADDAAVVVTLQANLKDYEAALKNAVRMTERAAKAAEDVISGIGKSRPPKFEAANQNFQKSAAQLEFDARNMQFQLNDIFSGLATGQGIRAVQMQLGQIAQIMGGGGIKQGAMIMGQAMLGMINPINLTVVAFGLLTAVAAKYFQSSTDAAKEFDKVMKETLETTNAIRASQGVKALDLSQTPTEQFASLRKGMEDNKKLSEELAKGFTRIKNEILGIPKDAFEGQTFVIQEVSNALSQLAEDIKNGKNSFLEFGQQMQEIELRPNLPKEIRDLVTEASNLAAKGALGAEQLAELQRAMNGVAEAEKLASDSLKLFNKGLEDMANIAKAQVDPMQQLNEIYMRIIGQAKTMGEVMSANKALAEGTTRVQFEERVANPSAAKEFLKTRAVGGPQGAIAQSLDRLDDSMATALVKLFQKLPDTVRITSGVRTYAEQAAIRSAHERMPGGVAAHPAARPGISRHEEGVVAAGGGAVDLSGVDPAVLKEAVDSMKELETLRGKTYQNDKMHVQLVGTANKVDKEAADQAQKFADQQADAAAKRDKNYKELLAQSQHSTELLTAEQKAIAENTNVKEDQNYALIRQKIELDLLNAARKDGIDLTEQERAAIAAAADTQARATVALAKTRQVVKDTEAARKAELAEQKKLMQEIGQLAEQAVGGFVNDLMNGVSAGQAFNNMLKSIVSSLAQMAVKSLFSQQGLGGIFGGIFGGGATGAASGGTVGLLHHMEKRNPLLWVGAPRFASGGVVGLRPGEVPIIAHKGEIILPTSSAMAARSGTIQTSQVNTSLGDVNIDMSQTGMVAANNDDAKSFGRNIQKLIQIEMVKESRPGGLLRKVPGTS